ncbi:MAG: trehalose-phosphatase [Woeseiaceae bacterium]|nr:trehalose-phosphatase [Woeseiaceae bacterium]
MQFEPATPIANDIALFLDIDGTLLEIEDRPERVRSSGALTRLLERVCGRLDGALALISGRTIAEIDRVFEPGRFPAAGAHGVEYRLPGGDIKFHTDLVVPDDAEQRLRQVTERIDGAFVERKNHGIALHYRQNPGARDELRAALSAERRELGDRFAILAGKMVFELVPRGYDKGAAIRFFLAREPFARRTPVFIGDDVTDEAGFAAVNALAGRSIRVGRPVASKAQAALPDVPAVHDCLRGLLDGAGDATRWGINP